LNYGPRKAYDETLMKPLFHPSIEDVTVETVLHALSDPARVAIFAEIAASQGSATCSAFQNIIDRPIPKSTLSQHFKVLREAGLIHAERKGVEMHNTSRCAEVDARFPGLISSIVNSYTLQSQQEMKRAKAAKRSRDNFEPAPLFRRRASVSLSNHHPSTEASPPHC
jgi:DNA-binding transcriptional ArsR family regulator